MTCDDTTGPAGLNGKCVKQIGHEGLQHIDAAGRTWERPYGLVRYRCVQPAGDGTVCGKTFGRAGALVRHSDVHRQAVIGA